METVSLPPLRSAQPAREHLDRSLAVAALLFLLLFLALEPLRTRIFEQSLRWGMSGWATFISLRLLLLVLCVATFLRALPAQAITRPRAVPIAPAGADALLTLRAYACVLVLTGHAVGVFFLSPQLPVWLSQGSPVWLLMGAPWAGVWIFFVLSGYLMGKGFYSGRYGLSRAGVAAFYRARMLRILPLYFVVVLVAVLALPDLFKRDRIGHVLSLVLLSQSPDSVLPPIFSLWSIQTELAFYAVMPLLFLLLDRLPSRVPVPATVLLLLLVGLCYRVGVLAWIGVPGWAEKVFVPLIANLDLFMLGMGLNWVVAPLARTWRSGHALAVAGLLLAAFYVLGAWVFGHAAFEITGVPVFRFHAWSLGPTISGLVAAAAILLAEVHAASRSGKPRGERFVRATQILGVLTYGIYAWHEPIFRRLALVLHGGVTLWPTLEAAVLGTAITLLVAWASHRWIQEPLERRKSVRPALPHG